MKNGIVIIGGNQSGKSELMRAVMALATSEGINVVMVEHESKPDFEKMILDFKAPALELPEPFFPRESAYERRNRNQPWYRQFEKRRR